MRIFTAMRDYFSDHTYAVWYDEKSFPIGIKSIELPWKDNQHDISCIPEGEYICTPYTSPTKIPPNVFLLQNTAPRTSVEIHVANFASDLKACIAPGLDFAIILNKHSNKVEAAVSSSSAALEKLKVITNYQPFKLIIKG